MPLYEYQCDPCGHRFEVIQKFSDAPLTVCPKCGGPVQKLLSSPAIQFKGSGWYITDYARAGKSDGAGSAPAASEGAAASSEKSSPAAKADAKSDTKTEAKTPAEPKAKADGPPSAASKSD